MATLVLCFQSNVTIHNLVSMNRYCSRSTLLDINSTTKHIFGTKEFKKQHFIRHHQYECLSATSSADNYYSSCKRKWQHEGSKEPFFLNIWIKKFNLSKCPLPEETSIWNSCLFFFYLFLLSINLFIFINQFKWFILKLMS